MTKARARWVIYVTLCLGLVFVLIPLPIEWRVIRPDAIALILFYWANSLTSQGGNFYGVLCWFVTRRD